MLEEDIQKLIKLGWWLSVVPVITGSNWQFKCDIYKRLPKSGNWITATRKTFNTPQSCYLGFNLFGKQTTCIDHYQIIVLLNQALLMDLVYLQQD